MTITYAMVERADYAARCRLARALGLRGDASVEQIVARLWQSNGRRTP